jgi:hypothetical protein
MLSCGTEPLYKNQFTEFEYLTAYVFFDPEKPCR